MASLPPSHLFFALFLLLLPLYALAQTSSKVTLGDSLSTDGNSSWVSSSGDFAFGFRSLGSRDRFLLAIWFDKIPEKTIVWSANGNSPVRRGSKVQLTTDGRLVLTDHQGEEIWKKEASNGTVTSAAMLNTGNFVLIGDGSATKWQSFHEPTDTILPTQELPLGTNLVARQSESNYTRGRFQLSMQKDGNLVLYPLASLSDLTYSAYWDTETVGNGTELVFNQTGYIYLPLKNGSLVYLTTDTIVPVPMSSNYQRATLDYDGVFRQYYHPRSPGSDGSWSQNWTTMQFVPDDICKAILTAVGGGACGFNSYCRLEDSRRPVCYCPPGYTFLDPNNTYKGCKQNFSPQSCVMDGSSEGPQFRLTTMDNVDWPLADYEHYDPVNEDQCQEACLSDCVCAVAIYRASTGDCWKKKLPLSNGRMNPDVDRRAFIKVPRGNSTGVGSLPSDDCSICGLNSYCKMDENQRPGCYCPPGYSFLDPKNQYKGCKQDFPPQNCDPVVLKGRPQYEMRALINTHWSDSNYEEYSPVGEDQCGEFCLNDCLCTAAGFTNGSCYKKRIPLSNGTMRPGVGATTFIKVSKNNSELLPWKVGGRKKDKALNLLGSLLLGSSVFFAFMLLLVIIFISYQRKSQVVRRDSRMLGKSLQSFTYKELEVATEGFKEQLGRGSFGTVYKGSLALADSATSIAVKKLHQVVEDDEKEFITEAVAIGQTHHKNLVKLFGFCNDGLRRLLVYEFMSNGSLSSFLFGDSRLTWNQRMQIALGIARGLTYLHEECINQIIHCDIKPQNILLDDNFTARISDFGLAKLLNADQTRTNTSVRGTRGYVGPEWLKKMPITSKVDVYSYGVMLLEIICCRKSVEPDAESEEEVILSDWVHDCYREGKLNLIVEGQQDEMVDGKQLERFVTVAIWCIQEEPTLRPSMKMVTQMLEGAVEVHAPPSLTSFSSLN